MLVASLVAAVASCQPDEGEDTETSAIVTETDTDTDTETDTETSAETIAETETETKAETGSGNFEIGAADTEGGFGEIIKPRSIA